jgi:hypothetical protein
MNWKKLTGAIMISLGAALTAFHIAPGPKIGTLDNLTSHDEPMIGISIFIAVLGIFVFWGNFKKKQGP